MAVAQIGRVAGVSAHELGVMHTCRENNNFVWARSASRKQVVNSDRFTEAKHILFIGALAEGGQSADKKNVFRLHETLTFDNMLSGCASRLHKITIFSTGVHDSKFM